MRTFTMFVLAALLMLVSASPQARADGSSGSQSGDDLTVCCEGVNAPPTEATLAARPLFQPQVVGCTAIGSDSNSINRCKGVVLGCSEDAFVCEPSKSSPGKKDCLCLDLLLKAAQF
jgi:hypothetical protein